MEQVRVLDLARPSHLHPHVGLGEARRTEQIDLLWILQRHVHDLRVCRCRGPRVSAKTLISNRASVRNVRLSEVEDVATRNLKLHIDCAVHSDTVRGVCIRVDRVEAIKRCSELHRRVIQLLRDNLCWSRACTQALFLHRTVIALVDGDTSSFLLVLFGHHCLRSFGARI